MAADHFATLGLGRGANVAEIKQAYRGLVKRYHPDINGPTADTERFLAVCDAYRALIDGGIVRDHAAPAHGKIPADIAAVKELLEHGLGPIYYAPHTLTVDSCRIFDEDKFFVDVEAPRSPAGRLMRMNLSYEAICPKCHGNRLAGSPHCFLCLGEGKYATTSHLELPIGPVLDDIVVYPCALKEFPLTVIVYPVS